MTGKLPFEVLQHIFIYLDFNKRDLLQTLFVCRDWNYATSEFLYKEPIIHEGRKARSFIAAISGTSNINVLIKEIILNSLHCKTPKKNYPNNVWDQYYTFKQIINFCPYITKIGKYAVVSSVYDHLIQAFNNNQLQHLKVIPKPIKSGDRYAYFSTALAFKNSIEELILYDKSAKYSSAKLYQLLNLNLSEFKALKKLKINVKSSNSIIVFDKIIQDCPLLVSLKIKLEQYCGSSPNDNYDDLLSIPRPDIKIFKGDWRIIGTDESLKYFMHKFPSLERLVLYSFDTFRFYSHSNKQNYPSILKLSEASLLIFFEYLLNIPYVNINLLFQNDIISFWAKFLKKSNTGVIFDYNQDRDTYVNKQNILFSRFSSKEPLNITLHFHTNKSDFDRFGWDFSPHDKTIDKVGHLIKRLEIRDIGAAHIPIDISSDDSDYTESDRIFNGTMNGYWLDEIFHRCNILEELVLVEPGFIRLFEKSEIKCINTSITKLKLVNWLPSNSFQLLYQISERLPSLSHLYSKYTLGYSEGKNISINMPFTSFETFFWDEDTYYRDKKKAWKIFMSLTTFTRQEYFEMHESGNIFKTSFEIYNKSLKDASNRSFNITCKEIKKFSVFILGKKQTFDMENPIVYFKK